eukprot:NP_497800.1 Uncharacterized protein CELE_Y1A5A.2 [Caenorhabditis elegans]
MSIWRIANDLLLLLFVPPFSAVPDVFSAKALKRNSRSVSVVYETYTHTCCCISLGASAHPTRSPRVPRKQHTAPSPPRREQQK